MDPRLSAKALLGRLAEPFTGEVLFDHLPDIVYFIKNAACQYVVVNQTLVERCGLREKSELIGLTAGEAVPSSLGAQFEAQDRGVLRTGRPLIAQLELQLQRWREAGWCLTTKLPLLDAEGEIIGLVGVSQDLRLPDASTREFQHVLAAVTYAEAHLESPPTVPQVAKVAGMSRFQLDRRMRAVFGLPTGQWLVKVRLDRAQRMLRNTDDPIAHIALRAGYTDQSAFTRQFRRATGLSPRDFRMARHLGPL